MKTTLSGNVNSIAIRKHFGPHTELEILDTVGHGDSRMTLYRAAITGSEVIETNGEPLWEVDDGFTEARALFINADDGSL